MLSGQKPRIQEMFFEFLIAPSKTTGKDCLQALNMDGRRALPGSSWMSAFSLTLWAGVMSGRRDSWTEMRARSYVGKTNFQSAATTSNISLTQEWVITAVQAPPPESYGVYYNFRAGPTSRISWGVFALDLTSWIRMFPNPLMFQRLTKVWEVLHTMAKNNGAWPHTPEIFALKKLKQGSHDEFKASSE